MTTIPPAIVVPETEPGGRIFLTMTNMMETVRAIFKVAGVPLPTRQYISDGAVAYDADQLVFSCGRLRPGRPGVPSLSAVTPGAVHSIEVEMHLLRLVPGQTDQGEAPTPEEITRSAMTLLQDWWVLYAGVLAARASGSVGDPGSLQGAPYREIMIQEIVPYGPEGQLGGLVATLVCELV